MIKVEDIKEGDTFYSVLLYVVHEWTCTGLQTFENKTHFMIEHNNGCTINQVCYKTEEEAVKIANVHRNGWLSRLEKEVEKAIKSVDDYKIEMQKPIEVRSHK